MNPKKQQINKKADTNRIRSNNTHKKPPDIKLTNLFIDISNFSKNQDGTHQIKTNDKKKKNKKK